MSGDHDVASEEPLPLSLLNNSAYLGSMLTLSKLAMDQSWRCYELTLWDA
ncbi:hypothetical protein SOASR015_18860 [Pectobacterium carotovorum subsp. carotovorum]|nr:hypothetical protein SOASR014_36590 [Pectobacterium carotovorum subsp. carotovorum]GKX42852.1 hypothetical protein SOASR015_18860 [Pectobacterium carotovorum subsp. carotovorum]GLX46124.1 hypothetical protein Pcaca01_37920 [Pectobacterium carotovorum subsp. carotovorum]GLX55716.1 hypothetical protein Pcaca02_10250 [Pectobacterium carotovorum subsp. carotovorum]